MITVSLTLEEAQAVAEAIHHGREASRNIRYQKALRTANDKVTSALWETTPAKAA